MVPRMSFFGKPPEPRPGRVQYGYVQNTRKVRLFFQGEEGLFEDCMIK